MVKKVHIIFEVLRYVKDRLTKIGTVTKPAICQAAWLLTFIELGPHGENLMQKYTYHVCASIWSAIL